ncbi:MAG: LysE family transporter [Anaerolineae bacterium]|nr:LysE family transporter [Anaerolineae bacterium]MCA9893276.1 LysE family transporter [Anaerolineae bacterium]
MLTEFIIPGISLALTATLLPGPLQAYILSVTLRYGWRRGMLVTFSPLITDAFIVPLVVFVLGQLPDAAIQAIRLTGGGLLLFIAWGAYKQLRAGSDFGPQEASVATPKQEEVSVWRVFIPALLMNTVSPGPWLFWATVNGPLLLSALEQSPWHALAFLVAFYGTFVLSLNVLVYIFGRLGALGPNMTHTMIVFTIGLLVYFGTALIAEALGLSSLHQGLSLFVIAALLFWWLVHRLKHRPQPENGK